MSSTYYEKIKRIRNSFPKAYDRWTEFDDALLQHEFAGGVCVSQLSKLLYRQPSAIRERIKKLGLKTNDEITNEKIIKGNNSLSADFQFLWTVVYCGEGKEYFFPQPISLYMLENYCYPAIYRWIIYRDSRRKIYYAYIGTTKQLCPGRLADYLVPASSSTDLRLHQEFRQFIKQGYKISLESLLVKEIKINNISVKLNNLHSQTTRVFIENLLISYYRQSGLVLLNQ